MEGNSELKLFGLRIRLGGVDLGWIFPSILSPWKVRALDGAKEFVLFLVEIDFKESLFISISEKVA